MTWTRLSSKEGLALGEHGHLGVLGREEVLHGGEHLLGLRVEEHPVNGLELEALVVDIDEFHQGVPGRVPHDGCPVGGLVPDLFPEELG